MVALVIIYNHQYNQNIEIVENIYKERFSHIFHLVPFYNGDKTNVIPVYCSSYYFQGYVAQGFKSYFKEVYDHYFFIADDLILNPVVNEHNYGEQLKLKPGSCFIPRLSTLDATNSFWHVNLAALLYNGESPGVEAKDQLPGYSEAQQILVRHGLVNKALQFNSIWKTPVTFKEWWQKVTSEKVYLARLIKNKLTGKKYELNYPLVRSYSDIFVISSVAIRQFSHYCGVFSATRLFVELAIPTSMVFTANEIITEKDLVLQGRALWTKEDHSLLDKYNYRLQDLLDHFPENYLYLHPVKLSKWK